MLSKDMFLNVLIVLFPVLLYQVFYDRSIHRPVFSSWWVTGLLCGLSSVLCLSFPFIDGNHVFWDLRALPLMLAVFYGGYRAGALALVMELIDRAYIGGGGAVFSISFTLVFMSVPFLLRKRFRQASARHRVMYGIVFSLGAYVLQVIVAAVNLRLHTSVSLSMEAMQKIAFLFSIGTLQVLTMALCVWLIENLRATNSLRVEMKRTEKLGILSELAASLAHEIRNPLTVVRGFLQLVSDSSDEKNKQYMNTAICELDRAVFIISDYLNFAKPQAETISVFDASRELGDVVGLMSSYAALHGVQVETDLQSGLWVSANQNLLKQAVLNLLKNSIEAAQITGGRVELLAYLDRQQIVVEVRDSGIGMTPAELDRVGEAFYSTKETGTGLGTMVTWRIVESMDGTLSYSSQKGIGTQATMRLPAVMLDT